MEALIVIAIIAVIIAVIRFVVTRDSKTPSFVEAEAPYKIETPAAAPDKVELAPVIETMVSPQIEAPAAAVVAVSVAPKAVTPRAAKPKAVKPKAAAAKTAKPKAPKMTIVK
jgi:hypothetical protein